MKKLLLCIFAVTFAAHASSGPKAPVTIRLHSPGNPNEGESFVRPVKVGFSREDFYIAKVPIISEKNIERIFLFQAADGTFGVTLALDTAGAQRIDEATSRERDAIILALVGHPGGQGRVASAMRVDRRINNGIVTIASGLTEVEKLALQARYPTIGKEREFREMQKEARAEKKRLAKANAAAAKQNRSNQ